MDEQHLDALPPVNVSVPQGENIAPVESVPLAQAETERKTFSEPTSSGLPTSKNPKDISLQADAAPAESLPVGSSTPTDTPLIADDADLIEKEWVEKAKQIVEQTKSDPYIQTQEVTKVKADYIKKRYNHDLKIAKD